MCSKIISKWALHRSTLNQPTSHLHTVTFFYGRSYWGVDVRGVGYGTDYFSSCLHLMSGTAKLLTSGELYLLVIQCRSLRDFLQSRMELQDDFFNCALKKGQSFKPILRAEGRTTNSGGFHVAWLTLSFNTQDDDAR